MSKFGINLVEDKKKISQNSPMAKRLRYLRVGSIMILFGIGCVSVIMSIMITLSPLPQLKQAEDNLKTDIFQFRVDMNKLVFINERGNTIRRIIKSRPYHDKKIEIVQNRVPSDVDFEAITIKEKNYTFRFTSSNLQSLDVLINHLVAMTGKDQEFSRAYLTKVGIDQDKNVFELIVDLLLV